jgi:hypothetical protein
MTAQTGMVLKASIRSFSSEGVQRSLAPRHAGVEPPVPAGLIASPCVRTRLDRGGLASWQMSR